MAYQKITIIDDKEWGKLFEPSRIRQIRNTGRSVAYLNNIKTRGTSLIPLPVLPVAFDTELQQFDGKPPKCQLVVKFDNVDPDEETYDPEVHQSLKQFRSIDDALTRAATFDMANWTGRAMADASEEERWAFARKLQFTAVKPGKVNEKTGKNWSDLIKFKIYIDDDGIPTGLNREPLEVRVKYPGKNRERIDPEKALGLLVRNARVRATVSPGMVWFKSAGRKKQFGIVWKVMGLEIHPYQRVQRVIDTRTFDPSKLVFPSDQTNSYGSPQVLVSYDGGRMAFKLPPARVMGDGEGEGVECYDENTEKMYLRLSFPDHRTNEETAGFVKAMESIETALVELADKRKGDWFDGDEDEEALRDALTRIIRKIGDTGDKPVPIAEPPYIKVKLPKSRRDGKWRTQFLDREGTVIQDDDVEAAIRRNTTVTAVIQSCPVYVMKSSGQFGISFEAATVTVDVLASEIHSPTNQSFDIEAMFGTDDTEATIDSSALAAAASKAIDATPDATNNDTAALDTDSDEDAVHVEAHHPQ